jgi:hypothetical protein
MVMVVLEEDKIEYQEANALHRQYLSLQMVVFPAFASASFAIFYLTWELKEVNDFIIYAFASIVLYLIGFAIWKRYTQFLEVIRKRIYVLEKRMGLDLHLLIKKRDEAAKLKSPILHQLSRVRFYCRILLPTLLGLLWVLRICIALGLFSKLLASL